MSRVVLTTVGTTGDVIPYLALARALLQRGHQVRVASHAIHRERFAAAGIDFVPAGAPFTVESFNRLLDEVALVREPLKQFEVLVRRLFLDQPERQLADQLAASRDADVVVAHRFDYLGQEAAIKNGVPWISVTLAPQILRTQEAPVYPFPRLGKWWTEFTWNGLEVMARPINIQISKILIGLGAPPRPLGVAGASSPYLNLIAASRHIVDVRGDWPANVHVTGPWIEEAPAHVPAPELAAFLARYPAPIVVTFGSMGGSSGAETNRILLEALARVDRPVIVQSGYSGLSGAAGEKIFNAGYVPHDYLFSRASCVVHHGGAGTSTAACRAGVPSATVPHLFDQYYWAGMLHDRGVAPKPLFRNQLTAKRLAARIEEALAPKRRAAAAALGEKIRGERGLEEAIGHITRVARS
jgi:UDP:flavonoid glycosyltransferase YjiC (YdhE family)